MNRRLFRYLVVGASSYIIEISALFALRHILKLSSVYSVSISFWVGLIAAFVLQKLVTFKNKSGSPKVLIRQSLEYGALILFNYLFSIGLVYVLEKHFSVYLIRTTAIVICTCWNYVFYKIIFREHEN